MAMVSFNILSQQRPCSATVSSYPYKLQSSSHIHELSIRSSGLCHMPTQSSSSGNSYLWLATKKRSGPLYSIFPQTPAAVSSVQDLFEFITSGPLLEKLGLTQEKVAESIDKWIECGSHLCRLFQINELYLTVPQKARIYHYYVPVFLWCEDQITRHRSLFKYGEDIPPIVVYMCYLVLFQTYPSHSN